MTIEKRGDKAETKFRSFAFNNKPPLRRRACQENTSEGKRFCSTNQALGGRGGQQVLCVEKRQQAAVAMNATKECCLESPVSVNRQKLQEIWSKLERLFDNGAKQDLVEIGGVKPLLDPGEAAEVKIEEIGAKDELEACCIAEVVVKESATEVEDKSCTAKAEVVVEMLAKDQVEKFCATKVELEKRCIAKVEVEEPRANQDEMEFCAAKDAEFELLRFVMAGCRAQDNNGEYG